MSWLAILLTLASLGGGAAPAPGKAPTIKQCNKIANAVKKKQCKQAAAKAKPKTKPKTKPGAKKPDPPAAQREDSPSTAPTNRSDPDDDPKATPTPVPTPGATPTPTPTPTPPVYPSRTGVDLTDGEVWSVRPSYRILAAGRIDFVTTNVGEDDHNLSVRGGGKEYGRINLAPGENDTLTLTLAAGPYTLYCSLEGHEEAGMRANISVR